MTDRQSDNSVEIVPMQFVVMRSDEQHGIPLAAYGPAPTEQAAQGLIVALGDLGISGTFEVFPLHVVAGDFTSPAAVESGR